MRASSRAPRHSEDFFAVRLDSLGEVLWEMYLGTDRNDECYEVLAMPDSGYAFAGTYRGRHLEDFILMRVGPDPVYNGINAPPDILHPTRFAVLPAYPNPFNSSTTIAYSLPCPEHITLAVYDIQGRPVRTLLSGVQQPGHQSLTWDANGVSSGIYIVRMSAGETSLSQKVLLAR